MHDFTTMSFKGRFLFSFKRCVNFTKENKTINLMCLHSNLYEKSALRALLKIMFKSLIWIQSYEISKRNFLGICKILDLAFLNQPISTDKQWHNSFHKPNQTWKISPQLTDSHKLQSVRWIKNRWLMSIFIVRSSMWHGATKTPKKAKQ